MLDSSLLGLRSLTCLVLVSLACAEASVERADSSDTGALTDDLVSLESDVAEDAQTGDVETGDVETGDDVAAPPWEGPADLRDLVQYVDPRIGTDNSGNVAVGAAIPHGWVRLGPDTVNEGLDIAAYRWGATLIEGFTHTQLSGAGGSGYGYSHVLVMPVVVGELPLEPADWASPFSHDDEQVSAGFYGVSLGSGVGVELTATGLAGLHRYRFPASETARIVVDFGHSLGRSVGGRIEVEDDRTISGYGDYQVHPTVSFLLGEEQTGSLRVYAVARFSRTFGDVALFRRGQAPGATSEKTFTGSGGVAVPSFGPTAAGDVIEVQVGLSLIDVETAKRNLEAEVGKRGFDEVRAEAEGLWNRRLNRMQITGSDDTMTQFYTALYHVMLQPADLTEAPAPGTEDGRFVSGFDGSASVNDAKGRRYFTDDWCLWDTFRTSHPLRTWLEPELMDDILESAVHAYREGGWLEVCPWAANGYSRVMVGNPIFPVVADALAKGFKDFDVETAYEAMVKSAETYLDNPLAEGACGYLELGTPDSYRTLGWVPDECDPTQAAGMTMEYAYADFALAEVAAWLGDADAEALYRSRSENWRNHWNAERGFMQSRYADGSWKEPFDPADGSSASGFVESSAWTYTFHVPHDVQALAELMGGDVASRAKLDAFFDGGHFDMANEPGFHIPWMYAALGDVDATVRRVDTLLRDRFGTGPGGLPGNDDSGATSAWLVYAQLGLYPITVGQGRYVLGSPTVDEATLWLHPGYAEGEKFVIRTVVKEPDARLVESVTLNGVPLTEPWITHAQVAAGGELVFTLSGK